MKAGALRSAQTSTRIPESQILREIMLALSSLRFPDGAPMCVVWRQQVGTFMGPSGHPVKVGLEGQADLGGVLSTGRMLQIEVKAENGRLSEAQERWGAMVQRMNGLWLVARSADDAVRAVREAIGG